jgi:hypothetical protein
MIARRYLVVVGSLPYASATSLASAVDLVFDGDRERGIAPLWDSDRSRTEILRTEPRFPYEAIRRIPLAVAATRVGRLSTAEGLNGDRSLRCPLAGAADATTNGGAARCP